MDAVNGSNGLEKLRRLRDAALLREKADVGDAIGAVLGAAVEGRSQAPSVSDRLKLKFGLGECAAKRLDLYRRLEKLVERHGEIAYRCISEAVAQAVGARNPGRYFCKAVLVKLREAGLSAGGAGGGDPTW